MRLDRSFHRLGKNEHCSRSRGQRPYAGESVTSVDEHVGSEVAVTIEGEIQQHGSFNARNTFCFFYYSGDT